MGHCSVAKVWQRKEDKTHELNIAAEVLNYPIEETLDTMLHEMVHLYCRQHDIKEVSRGGKYHNKRFKAIAEEHGLACVPCGAYGWNTTPGGKRPSSTRKVICPRCGQSVRATKKVNIICGVCMVPMVEAE